MESETLLYYQAYAKLLREFLPPLSPPSRIRTRVGDASYYYGGSEEFTTEADVTEIELDDEQLHRYLVPINIGLHTDILPLRHYDHLLRSIYIPISCNHVYLIHAQIALWRNGSSSEPLEDVLIRSLSPIDTYILPKKDLVQIQGRWYYQVVMVTPAIYLSDEIGIYFTGESPDMKGYVELIHLPSELKQRVEQVPRVKCSHDEEHLVFYRGGKAEVWARRNVNKESSVGVSSDDDLRYALNQKSDFAS